jgi:hypothetical protein
MAAGRVHFFPLVKGRATKGRLCTQEVLFFPLVAQGMTNGK